MDPNQPITTVRHGVWNVLKKAKCFLRGLLEWLREVLEKCKCYCKWGNVNKKIGDACTKCSIT